MCFSKWGERIDKSFIRIYDIYTLSCVVCWDGDDIPGTSVPEIKSGWFSQNSAAFYWAMRETSGRKIRCVLRSVLLGLVIERSAYEF